MHRNSILQLIKKSLKFLDNKLCLEMMKINLWLLNFMKIKNWDSFQNFKTFKLKIIRELMMILIQMRSIWRELKRSVLKILLKL